MKKRSLPFLIALIFLLFVTSANAQSARLPGNSVLLTFNGTKACCDVTIIADDLKSDINAVIKLLDGNTEINSWKVSECGYLYFSDSTTSVIRGRSYVLTVEYTISGTPQSTLKTSGVCK